jgi:hypothetical protein
VLSGRDFYFGGKKDFGSAKRFHKMPLLTPAQNMFLNDFSDIRFRDAQ